MISVEGRSEVAVAHLAVARSQNTGSGILGYLKMRRPYQVAFLIYLRLPYFMKEIKGYGKFIK